MYSMPNIKPLAHRTKVTNTKHNQFAEFRALIILLILKNLMSQLFS